MDDTFTAEPFVAPDGKMVVFVASVHHRSVQCSITRAALEQHIWLTPRADDTRMLKAFTNGQPAVAVAERRMLQAVDAPIALTATDFVDRECAISDTLTCRTLLAAFLQPGCGNRPAVGRAKQSAPPARWLRGLPQHNNDDEG